MADAIATGDSKLVNEALRTAQSEIDRAVKKGALHKNTAARQKSRLSHQSAPLIGKLPATKPKTTVTKATKTPAKAPATKAATKPASKKPAAKKTTK